MPVHPSPDATGTAAGAASLFAGTAEAGALPATAAPLDLPGLAALAERWERLAGAGDGDRDGAAPA